MTKEVELTKEELAAERQRQAELSQRRDHNVHTDLNDFANKNKGVAQTLYYAREGQYGKDIKVFTRVSEGYGWYDSTYYRASGLAIFHTKAELLAAIMRSSSEAISYVIFKRTFTPRWTIEEEEVAVIYDKGVK